MDTLELSLLLNDLHLPKRFSDKLMKDVEYIMKSEIINLELIVLFGSCVNGKLKITSDIDLLIITKERPDQIVRGDIASKLAEPINSVVTDVVFYTVDEIKSGKSLFLKQVMKEGIVIWRKD